MSKTKKVLSLLVMLIFTVGLVLTGCGSDKNKDKNASEVEVNIFQFKVEIAKELQSAINDYTKENPNVKINLQTVGGGDDYGAALKAKFQSGSEPAIFNIGGPQDVKDWMSKLEDLSDEPWVDLALDGMLSGATSEGKVYALPFNIEGYGFIYNKEIFKAAGIDAAEIKDFNSLEAAVKNLDKKIKNGDLKDQFPNLEAVFSYAAKETWVTGLHTSNAAFGQEFSNSIEAFEAEEVGFKNSEALKKIIDLQADYSLYKDAKQKLNAVDYSTQVDQGLAVERVAIIQQGNWIYNGVKEIDEKVAENLDILPMPIVGGKEDCIPVGVPMHWAVNKNCDEEVKAVAKDFLNWLYTSEKGKDYIVNKFYFIPPLKGYEKLEPQDSLGKAIKKYAESGKTTPWVFMGYPTGWGQDVLGANIQKYYADEYTWEEVVEDSQEQWKKMR